MPSQPRRFLIHTLGCKANAYDSDLLRQQLGARGWSAAGANDRVELVLVNSCTVTEEADRQSRKAAARLARRHPGARVVVTGCGAEVEPERYAATPGVDAVVGNQDKPSLLDLATRSTSADGVLGGVAAYPTGHKRARHDEERAWPAPEAAFLAPEPAGVRTRVFLKIQEGCDAFCTFCIVPYARGPARSLRPVDLVQQVRAVVAGGAAEVVLTGTALGDYGADLGVGGEVALEDLVELLLRETELPRLRLGSLDPREITPRLIRLMSEQPRLCPHVHVSLQSPHPLMLKRMKRRYRAEDAVTTLEALDRLGGELAAARGLAGGVFVGADVIAGFPGETEAVFEWTRRRLEALPWHRLHVFPYSERAGTAATRLDGEVPVPERRRRVRELMALSTRRLISRCEALAAADAELDVLVESVSGGPAGAAWVVGHSDNYHRVLLPAGDERAARGGVVRARVRAVHVDERSGDASLIGAPIGAPIGEAAAGGQR